MSSLPVLRPREVVRILEKLGFKEVRQRGSHRQYRLTDGRGTTVPFHADGTLLRRCCGRLPKTLG